MKQFVKALNKEGDCFQYICKAFAGLNNEKLKAGIFDGLKIRQLIKDTSFCPSISENIRILGINMSIKVHFRYIFFHLPLAACYFTQSN